jgi:hypothetical protein
VAPLYSGGWGYFHVTLVCEPGTEISRPRLSRTRYDALPVSGSQASETDHDVLPVERRFNGPDGVEVGGFFGPDLAREGSVATIADASG